MTAKEELHELVEEMSESEARAWVGRVCGARQSQTKPERLPDPARNTSNNAELLRLWTKWREEDANLPNDYVDEFDPENLPPVRFRMLKEMGLPEDGWD